MIIHVVEPGDTIESIAEAYGTSAPVLIEDNALSEPDSLVIGQSIVIAIPEITYIVEEGDTLGDIADSFNIAIMEMFQNNPYLSDREYIYPGDRLVISYRREGTIAIHGNTVPYINEAVYRKTLPYLTYLSVVNYTATDTGEIVTHYDDLTIIQAAKDYSVIPLMFLSTITLQGEANIRGAYELLLSEEYQDNLYENTITILREKNYYGVNFSIEYVSEFNLPLIFRAYSRIGSRLRSNGYLVFVTINPNIDMINDEVVFNRVDYTEAVTLVDRMIFMNYEMAKNVNPPSPISSLYEINAYLNYLVEYIPREMLNIGLATLGYDWALPFLAGVSSVNSLTIDSAIELARDVGAIIQFDEQSHTPYYNYTNIQGQFPVEHIVWFIDARSIDGLLGLVRKYGLQGSGIWNITVYNAQLWLIINSQFQIEKLEVSPTP